MDISEKQKHILRHSLGLTTGKTMYRRHFVTGEGSDDFEDCCALVEAGLMIRNSGGPLSGGDDIFTVTKAGVKAASE